MVDNILPINNESSNFLEIDELQIQPELVIAFASGFSYLTRQQNYISTDLEINNLPQKHSEKLKTRVLLFFFIAFIF